MSNFVTFGERVGFCVVVAERAFGSYNFWVFHFWLIKEFLLFQLKNTSQRFKANHWVSAVLKDTSFLLDSLGKRPLFRGLISPIIPTKIRDCPFVP